MKGFTSRLPVSAGVPSLHSVSGARLLIIDFSPTSRDSLRRLLAPTYEVQAPDDPASAFEAVAAFNPDLIVTDADVLREPAFLQALTGAHEGRPPSILLLARADSALPQLAWSSACIEDCLFRPFSPGELLARIESRLKILRHRRETVSRSQEQLALAAEAAGLGTWSVDASGVLRCCERARSMHGIPDDKDLRAVWALRFIRRADRPAVLAELRRVRREGGSFRVEYRVSDAGGAERWVLSSGQVSQKEKGGCLLGLVQDITDRRRIEEALREADRRKDEFLTVLAHELRNPLAAISAGVNLLCLPRLSKERSDMVKETLKQRTKQIAQLIDDLLDVSRIVRGKVQLKRENISLSAVVERAVAAVRQLMEDRCHKLALSMPEPIVVYADPVRLEQILVNLLTNAAKYTDRGGEISLSVRAEGERVLISVRDNGIGIEDTMKNRIFELFGQVDDSLHRSAGGLGIGLTLVQRLTLLHGGSVTVESEGSGKGSLFSVRLPLSRSAAVPVQPPARQQCRSLNLLLVEDHVDTAFMTAALLQSHGHHVAVAHDGLRAIEMALKKRPDVILLDLGLPLADGYEVARQVRRQGLVNTLIVAISGYGQDRDLERSREAGIDHHLLKPVDYDQLVSLLSEWETSGRFQGQRAQLALPLGKDHLTQRA